MISFERHSLKNSEYESLDDNYWCLNEDPLLDATVVEDEGIVEQEGKKFLKIDLTFNLEKHNTILTGSSNISNHI